MFFKKGGCLAKQRDLGLYHCPRLAPRYCKLAAKLPDALAHSGYSDTQLLAFQNVRRQALAIVPHAHHDRFALLVYLHARALGLRMAHHVRQRFLDDAKDRRFDLSAKPRKRLRPDQQRDLDAASFLHALPQTSAAPLAARFRPAAAGAADTTGF